LPFSSAKAGEGEKIISQENRRGSEMETKERYVTQRVKSGKICNSSSRIGQNKNKREVNKERHQEQKKLLRE